VGLLELDRVADTVSLTVGDGRRTILLARPFGLVAGWVAPGGLYPQVRSALVLEQGDVRIGFWCINRMRDAVDGAPLRAPPVDLGTDRRGRVLYEHLLARVKGA
jgi:hypothetical protein